MRPHCCVRRAAVVAALAAAAAAVINLAGNVSNCQGKTSRAEPKVAKLRDSLHARRV